MLNINHINLHGFILFCVLWGLRAFLRFKITDFQTTCLVPCREWPVLVALENVPIVPSNHYGPIPGVPVDQLGDLEFRYVSDWLSCKSKIGYTSDIVAVLVLIILSELTFIVSCGIHFFK